MSRVKTSLPESLATTVKATIADWQSRGTIERLWNRDATLWTGTDDGMVWVTRDGGKISSKSRSLSKTNFRSLPRKCRAVASSMCCCSAWADPVYVRKFCA